MTVKATLRVEKALKDRCTKQEKPFFDKYLNLKRELFSEEYLFTLHEFPGGNDHGPSHIERVLEYIDQLIGGSTKSFTDLELYLLLCSVLLHDQGMLQGRENHPRVSQRLLKLPEYRLVFDGVQERYAGKLVAMHGGSGKIEEEFRGYDKSEGVTGDTVRPMYLAALLRLADELDEDHRRGKRRIFHKLALPERSMIYWLVNLSIASIRVKHDEQRIEVVAEYELDDLKDLFPFAKQGRVNVVAGVFRKMQKLNRERQYCMRFFDKETSLKEVLLRFRNLTDNTVREVMLSDANDGDDFFAKNSDLFKEEQSPPSLTLVTQPAKSTDVPQVPSDPMITPLSDSRSAAGRRWSELLRDEQAKARQSRGEFISDALEIVERPDLYGRWELMASGVDLHVTLQTLIFPTPSVDSPLLVEIFPIGKYPISPPELSVRGDSGVPAQGLENHLQVFRSQLQVLWPERYRSISHGRLVHVADTIAEFQNPIALFRSHARDACANRRGSWRLEGIDDLRLEYSCGKKAEQYCIAIRSSLRYSIIRPRVTCAPVLPTRYWLGTGELNWQAMAGNDSGHDLWSQFALRGGNPLEHLMTSLELAGG